MQNFHVYMMRVKMRVQNNRIQTKYLVNAAYLRLKNITLGYTLPNFLVSKVSLSNAKIFFLQKISIRGINFLKDMIRSV